MPKDAIKTLKDLRALGFVNTRPIVDHPQHDRVARDLHLHHDMAILRRVAQGIVHQVRNHFTQHGRIAIYKSGLSPAFEGQIDVFLQRQRRQFAGDIARQLAKIQARKILDQPVGRLCAGQRQHLISHPARTANGIDHATERPAHFFRIVLAQTVFRLRTQHGQRRSDLVRGIGQKPPAGLQQAVQTRHVVVDGIDQRQQFIRHIGFRYRRQILVLALSDRVAQVQQRAERAAQDQQDQDQSGREQQQLRPQTVDEQAEGEACTRLRRFGKEHRYRIPPGELWVVQTLGQRSQADRLLAKNRVDDFRLLARAFQTMKGQVVVPGDDISLRPDDRVENPLLHAFLEDIQRRVGNIDGDMTAGGVDALGNVLERGGQRTVVGPVGRIDGAGVEPESVDPQQDEHRRNQRPGNAFAQAERAERTPPTPHCRFRSAHSRVRAGC